MEEEEEKEVVVGGEVGDTVERVVRVIGNPMRINRAMYEGLVERAEEMENNEKVDNSFKKIVKLIEEDIHRTFSNLPHFKV
jgi:hypothetical protein